MQRFIARPPEMFQHEVGHRDASPRRDLTLSKGDSFNRKELD